MNKNSYMLPLNSKWQKKHKGEQNCGSQLENEDWFQGFG